MRKFLIGSLFFLVLFLYPGKILAQESVLFSNKIFSRYYINLDGQASVSQEFTIKHLNPNIYPTTYTIELNPEQVETLVAQKDGTQLELEKISDGLQVRFPEPNSANQETHFRVDYNYRDFIVTEANLSEIVIPLVKASENIKVEEQKLELILPAEFGPIQQSNFGYLQGQTVQGGLQINLLADPDRVDNGSSELRLVLGKYQLYDFILMYKLENQESAKQQFEVTIPPDVPPYQTLYLDSVNPKPDQLERDSDGNILAYYTLKPDQQISVRVKGQIAISLVMPAAQDSLPLETQTRYLLADKYWPVNDERILAIVKEQDQPEEIFTYVVNNLIYDESKLEAEQVSRLGALGVLEAKNRAVCMEFTDLTVTLMRAAGIPARAVDGYAYLEEDEKLRPTLDDVLHTWVQYWDQDQGWRNIDPTWGSTTKQDYFNNFDHGHIILAIKGVSSTYPDTAGTYFSHDLDANNLQFAISDSPEPGYPTFSEWQEQYELSKLPWWTRLWQWLSGVFLAFFRL